MYQWRAQLPVSDDAAVMGFPRVHWVLLLGGLLAYGLLVDPETGQGGLPCLWRLSTGSDCFGCGLSRAGALLLRGRVAEAAAENWLIFPAIGLIGSDIGRSCLRNCSMEDTNGRTWRR